MSHTFVGACLQGCGTHACIGLRQLVRTLNDATGGKGKMCRPRARTSFCTMRRTALLKEMRRISALVLAAASVGAHNLDRPVPTQLREPPNSCCLVNCILGRRTKRRKAAQTAELLIVPLWIRRFVMRRAFDLSLVWFVLDPIPISGYEGGSSTLAAWLMGIAASLRPLLSNKL